MTFVFFSLHLLIEWTQVKTDWKKEEIAVQRKERAAFRSLLLGGSKKGLGPGSKKDLK